MEKRNFDTQFKGLDQEKLIDRFKTACIEGDLEIVQYLLLNEGTEKQVDRDVGFVLSCQYGNLNIVKYLLTSIELNFHANIHYGNESGFCLACKEGHLEVVEYLLTSPDLKEHADIHCQEDFGFKMAYKYNQFDIVKYLILDMDLGTTISVQDFLKRNPNEQIDSWFKVKELNNKLNKELTSNKKISHKRMKV